MRHSRAIDYLRAYDRSDLSSLQRERLDFHLSECAECTQEAQKMASLKPFLARMAEEATISGLDQALESVRQRTMRAVRLESEKPAHALLGWLSAFPRLVLAVPAAVAAVVLGILLFPKMEPQAPRAVEAMAQSPSGSRMAVSQDFTMARQGAQVQIQWARTGARHYVRRGTDPISVKVAGRQVAGPVWKELNGSRNQVPGTVTYYLVD